MARATPYSIGPNTGATAHTKIGGGAISWAPGFGWIWSVNCIVKQTASGPAIGDTALSAGLTQALSLNTAFPASTFPENVQVGEAYIKHITDFSGTGITALDVELGDAADDDELLTSTSVFTGVGASYIDTTAAAAYAMHVESAYVPLLTLTATGANLDQLSAGQLKVCIPIRPLHD